MLVILGFSVSERCILLGTVRSFLLGTFTIVSACSLLTDVSGLGKGGSDATIDAPLDVQSDASPDAPPDPYNDMTNASLWSSFDLAQVTSAAKYATGFFGVAFDGRYLYLVPNADSTNYVPQGVMVRFDTTAPFTSNTSWSTFDTTTVNANADGFAGAAFDGRYVYLVPNFSSAGRSGLVTRYDTTAGFTAAASWSTFDTTSVNPSSKSFIGATFDGRFVYFVPYYNGAYNGVTARYDTTAAFGSAGSWSTFDISSVNPNANGFVGAAFDGRFVYYVPLRTATAVDGVVARYDSTLSFVMPEAWSTFDATTVDTRAKGFEGAVFDGRYLYLVPYDAGTNAYDGVVARFDTTASFTAIASWSTFDTANVNPAARGFDFGAFDGRYVYLAPYFNNGALDGVVTRYDTTATFGASASWSTFDAASLNPNATGFEAAAFDGRYVYFVPSANSIIVRFDARSPPSMPKLPGWNGSFF